MRNFQIEFPHYNGGSDGGGEGGRGGWGRDHALASNTDAVEKLNIGNSCEKFIRGSEQFSVAFNSLSDEKKSWMLDYLSGGKGVIPYEKIQTCNDLDSVPSPSKECFAKTKFYSSLKMK